MNHPNWRLAPVAILLALAACSNPLLSPKPWDDYAGETLKVYGQDPATAGQVVWRAVREQDGSRDFLATQGEPDSLEIRGGKFSQKTIILYYTRHGVGAPHSVQLDPAKNGFTPRAPEPMAVPEQPKAAEKPKPTSHHNAHQKPSETPPANTEHAPDHPSGDATPAAPAASAPAHTGASGKQRVECPVDPMRPDCQALCTSGATYEWCH